ncbi:MAG: hypothetical protein A3G20_02370 [Acidobacteria bacterium RIFCSPLOWO2_12_FULL_59_11]|nr:MAG: hypothetical protein A3G20_02370 [Acidobacteria bacterium RIFCSPLOWO2_12_FULL_59_11]
MLEKVCECCNSKIGNETETQFLRTGPIAFFRWMIGIKGRKGLPPSPFYKGAGGAPPIYAIARAPGFPFDLLWEICFGTEDCFPLRQVVFEHPLAGTHPIPILDSMREHPDILLSELQERGLEHAKPIHAFAAPDEIPFVSELIAAVGGKPAEDWVTTKFEPQRLEIVLTVSVTSAFFRAVAKIGFHYALKMFPQLTGMESEFEGIKSFIWKGGDSSRFVLQRLDHIVENFRRGYRPMGWCHILSVVRSYDQIVVFTQFFTGPRSLPPTYEIRLGRDPSRIITRSERKAHIFLYPDPSVGVGPGGLMADLDPANYVFPPGMLT